LKLKLSLLAALALFAIPLHSRDFKETEQIINTILSDDRGAPQKAGEQKQEPLRKEQAPQLKEQLRQKEQAPQAEQARENEGGDGATAESSGKEKKEKKQKETLGMSQSDEVLLKTGIQFYNSGLYPFSLKQFGELMTKYPQSQFRDSAAMYSGKIYFKQHQYDKAIEQYASIQDKSGEYPNALYYTAETHSVKGDPQQSIEFYAKVSSLFPDHELADDALLKVGRLYLNQQKGLQALDTTLTLIKYYSARETVDDAYYLLGTIFMKDPALKDFEKARKIYRSFMKKAAEGEPRFSKSPLRFRVQSELSRIEKNYYKLEQ
jgi:TolA-binding protein